MPLPKAGHPVVCRLCGVAINPLVARYLFLAVGWRGRGAVGSVGTSTAAFCGPCARQILDRVGYLLPREMRERVLR